MEGRESRLYKFLNYFQPAQSLFLLFLLASVGMSLIFTIIISLIFINTRVWDFLLCIIIFDVFMLSMRRVKMTDMGNTLDYVIKKFEAVEINQFSYNPIIGRYTQIVSDLVVATGIQRPKLFALSTYEINIFTVTAIDGTTAIFVTEGALTRLTKTELSALAGREISRILNSDSVMNFQLIGWLHGLQSVYLYGYMMFNTLSFGCFGDLNFLHRYCLGYSLREVGDGAGSQANTKDFYGCLSMLLVFLFLPATCVALAIMLVGSVGAILAKLVKSAISKEHSDHADRESLHFANGHYIVAVLEKIALLESDDGDYSLTLLDASHQEFSHCYLQNYQQKQMVRDISLPILKRIHRVQPHYKVALKSKVEVLEQKVVDQDEATDKVLVAFLASYFERKKISAGCNLIIELSLANSGRIFFSKLAVCYAVFITTADLDRQAKQWAFLEKKLSEALFLLVKQSFDRTKEMQSFNKLKELMANIPRLRELANFQLLEIENICQQLLVIDKKLTIAKYSNILLIKGLVGKVIKERAIEHPLPAKSIAIEKIAALLSVITTIAFYPRRSSAQKCYTDIAAFLSINILYNEDLHWKRTLDQCLTLPAELPMEDLQKLEIVFSQLLDLKQVSIDGRCVLLTLITILDFYLE